MQEQLVFRHPPLQSIKLTNYIDQLSEVFAMMMKKMFHEREQFEMLASEQLLPEGPSCS